MRTVQYHGHTPVFSRVKGLTQVSCSCGCQLGRYPSVVAGEQAHDDHVFEARLNARLVALKKHFDDRR